MAIVFWGSLLTLIYIYLGYPLLVWGLARLFGRPPTRRPMTPSVSLLIPAYNEEAQLEQKLLNSLALDYPRDQLELVVASDGSTDGTHALVTRFRGRGVRLIAMARHAGKATMLSRTIPLLRGDIVVLSDVSSRLERDAVRQLVSNFADARVGCVCGRYRLAGQADLRAQGEGAYWRYETFLKRQESRLHSIMGAHGAFYAIRKRVFACLEAGLINDDYLIPMRIVEQGYRAVYEPAAVAWESEHGSVEGEFTRRQRIAAGNCQQIVELRRLLMPGRGWVAWCFLSHKVLRTFAPLLMLVLLVSSFSLPHPWAAAALAAQLLLYASGYVGYVCQQRGRLVRWLSAPFYFCFGNLAMLVGLYTYCVRRQRPMWSAARESQ